MLVLGGLGEDWNYPNEVVDDPSQQGEGSGLNEPMWVTKSLVDSQHLIYQIVEK